MAENKNITALSDDELDGVAGGAGSNELLNNCPVKVGQIWIRKGTDKRFLDAGRVRITDVYVKGSDIYVHIIAYNDVEYDEELSFLLDRFYKDESK